MHICRMISVFIFFFVMAPAPGVSDTLVIPNIANQPNNVPDNIPRPARAMSMDQVREEFGLPNEVLGPVGKPPITRWLYEDFVVHFEGEYVIHSVVKRNQ